MKFCKQKRHFSKILFAQIPCSRPCQQTLWGFGIRSGFVRDSMWSYFAKYLHIFGKVSPHIWPSIWTYFFSTLLGVINRKIAVIPYRYYPINQFPPHFAQITI